MSLCDFSGRKSASVVIVNYNAGALLTACVRRALNQAGQVVVVDNASSDESLKMLSDKVADAENLKIIRAGRNLGFAAGCNIGLKAAANPCVLFLNPDCLLNEEALCRMTAVLASDDKIGMAGGRLVNPDQTEQRGSRRLAPTPWSGLVRALGLQRFSDRRPRLFADFNQHRRPVPDGPVEVEAISGAFMLVKKQVIEDVGLWDERYFLHCEDLDICMRFRQAGWKIVFVPNASAVHYQGACGVSSRLFVERHKHRGMVRYCKKFFRRQYSGALTWAVVFGVWLHFLATAGMIAFERFRNGKRDSRI